MNGRSCTVVLIGTGTAGRKWIKHEIEKTWNDGKGLVGIYIHNLKNLAGQQSSQGNNPFSEYNINRANLANIVKTYNPPYSDNQSVCNYINNNIANWIEEAIDIRSSY